MATIKRTLELIRDPFEPEELEAASYFSNQSELDKKWCIEFCAEGMCYTWEDLTGEQIPEGTEEIVLTVTSELPDDPDFVELRKPAPGSSGIWFLTAPDMDNNSPWPYGFDKWLDDKFEGTDRVYAKLEWSK